MNKKPAARCRNGRKRVSLATGRSRHAPRSLALRPRLATGLPEQLIHLILIKIAEKRNLSGGRCGVTRLGETQMRDHVGASLKHATLRPTASPLACLRGHVSP